MISQAFIESKLRALARSFELHDNAYIIRGMYMHVGDVVFWYDLMGDWAVLKLCMSFPCVRHRFWLFGGLCVRNHVVIGNISCDDLHMAQVCARHARIFLITKNQYHRR